MKNKKVLVTGSSGFIGSHVADSLEEEGYNVVLFDSVPSKYKSKTQQEFIGNILNPDDIETAMKGCEIIYHFAAQSDIGVSSDIPTTTITANIIGTQNVLEAARKHKVNRFLFASTIYVYSELGSFYRVSKQACEKIIEEYRKVYDLNYTILRYGSLYGTRSNSFNSIRNMLKEALDNSEIIRRGDGEEIREYINIIDAAKLSVRVIDKEFANKHIIVTGNQSMKIRELLSMIKEIFEDNIKIIYKPSDEQHHYQITPFSFRSQVAERLTPNTFIDIGQGILEVLNELHHEKYESNDDPKISLREKDK
jgi:UDP-glucose 4-epimerase